MGSTILISLTFLLAAALSSHAQTNDDAIKPPANLGRPYGDEAGNLTMDEIITGALGGPEVASHYIMGDGGQILAELDMYLSEKQFLSMYEPPKPDEMEAMGYASSHDPNVDIVETRWRRDLRYKRKATSNENTRWRNAEMPYKFAKGHFEPKEEYMMRRAMTEWEKYTCLSFRPSTGQDKNSVRFQNGVGCNSQLGMVGGIQTLNLQAPGCRYKGLYLHEIGHAVGLVHEHQLPNRDNYIEILYYNVADHMKIWFNPYKHQEVNQMGIPYEYSSVMHYGITAFSKDGRSQTIRAKFKSEEENIGKVYLKELAYTDVAIVNKMYNCAGDCPDTDKHKCGQEGHLDQNCNCICRDGSDSCDTSKQKDTECKNKYKSWACYIWANQGECDRNPFYMNNQCAKSCDQCDDSKQTKTKKKRVSLTWTWQWLPMFANMLPPEWNTGNELVPCKDVYREEKCRVWKERGDCLTNKMWMTKNCPITCDLCNDGEGRPEVNCENSHTKETECHDWAKDGECVVNKEWMSHNCRKSCHMCDVDLTDTDGTDEGITDEDKMECIDTNTDCAAWAKNGECTTNPNWMIHNCRKSCEKCDNGMCKNLFDDKQCKIWAQKLECVSNGKWMALHCAKSCGRGKCEGEATTATARPTRTRTPGRTTSKVTSFCENTHNSDHECDIWAKNGHCNINPRWMNKHCAKSCKECQDAQGEIQTTSEPKTVTSNCKNKHQPDTNKCEQWAKSGHCESNPSWMIKNCASSCKACPTVRPTARTTSAPKTGRSKICVDNNENCLAWARDGYCDSNAQFNLINCKKSCNNCNGCRDTEFLCAVWAKSGHCTENARYMLRHCQESCNACE